VVLPQELVVAAMGIRMVSAGIGIVAAGIRIVSAGIGIVATGIGIVSAGIGIVATGIGIVSAGFGIVATGIRIVSAGLGIVATAIGIVATTTWEAAITIFDGNNLKIKVIYWLPPITSITELPVVPSLEFRGCILPDTHPDVFRSPHGVAFFHSEGSIEIRNVGHRPVYAEECGRMHIGVDLVGKRFGTGMHHPA
jgi:hypothetical protein